MSEESFQRFSCSQKVSCHCIFNSAFMVSCQSGEKSLELVIMNRMGQIIGLVVVCRVEMELNIFSILRLYHSTVY